MKHINESIRDRRGGKYQPVLKKIKNPSYEDLVPYNIVRHNNPDPDDFVEYGIIVPEELARSFFPRYQHKSGSVILDFSRLTDMNLTFLPIQNYKQNFPHGDFRNNFDIIDIWDGSKYESYFRNILQNRDDFVNFLRPVQENPEEFKKMLSK